MKLTLEILFNNADVVKAVIDRTMATQQDEIFWRRYLDFEETKSRVFKTYLGTVTGVTPGSIIDRNSNKPLRERKSLGSGYGEVAHLGNRYQMDKDRLDMIKSLIDKFNAAKPADQVSAMNAIIDYIVDDVRNVRLAPHKRMDLVVGDLRSDGKASVTMEDNPLGIALLEMELPVKRVTPTPADKDNFITYLKTQIEAMRPTMGRFSVMEMTRSTFTKNIVGAKEFQNTYKMILSGAQMAMAGGLITDTMTNQVFSGIGLPPIRIIDDMVGTPDGKGSVLTFKEDRITLLPQDKIGKMMWHEPYEISDPVPNKAYTRLEGGMWISNWRTDEGRFMEYEAEWIPNFTAPNKIAIFDLSTMNG